MYRVVLTKIVSSDGTSQRLQNVEIARADQVVTMAADGSADDSPGKVFINQIVEASEVVALNMCGQDSEGQRSYLGFILVTKRNLADTIFTYSASSDDFNVCESKAAEDTPYLQIGQRDRFSS